MYDDDLRFSGMAKWQNSVQTRIVALAARCGDVSQAYDSACSRTPNHAWQSSEVRNNWRRNDRTLANLSSLWSDVRPVCHDHRLVEAAAAAATATPCLRKTVHFCFCHNFVKFPRNFHVTRACWDISISVLVKCFSFVVNVIVILLHTLVKIVRSHHCLFVSCSYFFLLLLILPLVVNKDVHKFW